MSGITSDAAPPPRMRPAVVESRLLQSGSSTGGLDQWTVRQSLVVVMADDLITPTEADSKRFRRLADQWISETAMYSDPVPVFLHKSLFKIIGMGEKVLPLILKEVEKNSAQWFVALDAISPVNPIKPEDEKNSGRMRNAWIEWGRSKGLI